MDSVIKKTPLLDLYIQTQLNEEMQEIDNKKIVKLLRNLLQEESKDNITLN